MRFILERLCEKIKILRTKIGITQLEVANLIGVDRSTYSYYELGKTMPNWDIVKKLAKIFNVSYYDLLEEENKFICSDIISSKVEHIASDNLFGLDYYEKKLIMLIRKFPENERFAVINNMIKTIRKYSKSTPLSNE